jgi:Flp pilus assembly secretin CpaC
VAVEVRFVTVADRFFERIGVDFDFNVQDNVGPDTLGLPRFGTPGGTGVQGDHGDGGDTGDAATTGVQPFFDTPQGLNLPNLDDWPQDGTIVGLAAPDTFTQSLDVGFRQGSFDIGVPDFGNFQPDAGIQVGMAILSDLEAFFFISAAQGDERTNLLFAPKVMLFNGQSAIIMDIVARPFVISVIPTVGPFAVGFTPVITQIPEGIILQVSAVISADRRFVRLNVSPYFSNITDVFTFSFISSSQGQAGPTGAGGGQQPQGTPFGQGGGASGAAFGGGTGGGAFSIDDVLPTSQSAQFGFGGIGGGSTIRGSLILGLPMQIGAAQQAQQAQQAQTGQTGLDASQSITLQQPVQEIVNVQTTVSVPDGGTVLLGGMKRLREGRNMAGVPILNKVPYISRLFKNTGVGRETESLMLMVTPRIIIHEEEEESLGIEVEE